MTVAHFCHARGCTVEVPPRMFMCRRHWRMLPARLRSAIWRHYRPGQETDKQPSARYLDVAREAVEWLARHEQADTSQGSLL